MKLPTSLRINGRSFSLSFLRFLSFIPRHIGIVPNAHITLVGFADASERCYGAVVYVRVLTLLSCEDTIGSVNLLCSKSRIAPLRIIYLARLECAALVLANLMSSVRVTGN